MLPYSSPSTVLPSPSASVRRKRGILRTQPHYPPPFSLDWATMPFIHFFKYTDKEPGLRFFPRDVASFFGCLFSRGRQDIRACCRVFFAPMIQEMAPDCSCPIKVFLRLFHRHILAGRATESPPLSFFFRYSRHLPVKVRRFGSVF